MQVQCKAVYFSKDTKPVALVAFPLAIAVGQVATTKYAPSFVYFCKEDKLAEQGGSEIN